ncbi:outer membrane lipoprotein-sorting protein [Prosthecobacter fusiformis]|uniref:Outer membrane lipoprotein-sorting protein n=1 Tax=Prosthecobacter fusiformis TaxID=48464 RepID=A0A4R7S5U6_9BACT|nr:outer membrane lipoprotein-sorting protein [Prosthecobacter fusiformis]TDU72918.1 outer membrane lipoprotein-sorting protein [Prosthecobacter fusiformis]
MKRRLLLACLATVASSSMAQSVATPTAAEILGLVRRSYAMQDHKMTGKLRDEDTGKVEPLELTLTKSVMRFRFSNPPAEIIHLDLTTSPATLWQVKAGGSSQVPLKNAADSVREMDFNYEDLSQRFLYWKDVKMMNANARITAARIKCWLVRVTAPDTSGPYYTVDLWVHQESGGVAKMEAYNSASKLVKRFEVMKVWKVGEASALREMRVQSFNPLNGDRKGMTYMTMDKPEKQ